MSRENLQRALELALVRASRNGDPLSLLLFSIDRFKLINTRLGHERADDVLHRVGTVTKGTLRSRGKSGRWAGDEFLCVLPTDCASAQSIAEELRQAIAATIIAVDGDILSVTASFGLACYPDDGIDAPALLLAADEAVEQAKLEGRDRVAVAAEKRAGGLRVGSMLETALREERVMAAYQPIVELATERRVAAEALARVVTPEGDVMAAERFMGVATQFQLTHRIDRAVVLDALAHAAGSPDRLLCFVNISGDLLRHRDVLRELLQAAQRLYPVMSEPKPIVIEVTERELLGNLAATKQALAPFLDFGVRLALDDFGSGYSSFQYLADLPVSFLKIDGGLIRRLQEPKVRALVHGIQAIANELEIITLAEYIESERDVDLLRQAGVQWGQGHYYGEPAVDTDEARRRREMSVNWNHGYYCRS